MMTRRQAIAAGLALTAGAALPVRAARASAPNPADPEFFPWTALGEGVHAIIDPATGGNCLLAVDAGQAILVDTKFPAIAPALLREATARAGRLAHVVNTHHHLDHTGGNHAFRAAGVPVVAHHRAGPRIAGNFEQAARHARGGPGFVANLDRAGQSRTLKDAGTLIEALPGMDAGDWAPTALLDEAETELRFGARTAVLRHLGHAAHTDNDTIVLIPHANVIHTGDLVFGGRHPYFDPDGGVSVRGWIRTLREARALCKDDTTVVPGHGRPGVGPSVLDRQREYLERLVEAVQAEIDRGVPHDEAVQRSWGFMDGLEGEQVRARAISAVYRELAGRD